MYSESFFNTFVADILEVFGLIKVNELPNGHLKNVETKYDSGINTIVLRPDNEREWDLERQIKVNESMYVNESDNNADYFKIDWDGPDDPGNPMNWSKLKKGFLVLQIQILKCITYMGASIYTPGQDDIQKKFHVGHVVTTLNLSMYALGYGIGPLIFSPLSEIARFGRQRIYIVTLLIFMVFQAGAAMVNNVGGLIIIRFMGGIFCSPSLATGAASMGDFISPEKLPLFVGLWAIGALAAPVTAPLLGASMLVAKNWRYIFLVIAVVIRCNSTSFGFFLSGNST